MEFFNYWAAGHTLLNYLSNFIIIHRAQNQLFFSQFNMVTRYYVFCCEFGKFVQIFTKVNIPHQNRLHWQKYFTLSRRVDVLFIVPYLIDLSQKMDIDVHGSR